MNNVYLISAQYGNDIIWKVGVSKHPEQRFKEHKVANPNLIKINALFECNKENAYFIESRIKNYLSDFKIDGEWFDGISLTPELFLEYCEKFYEHSISYFELKKKLNN